MGNGLPSLIERRRWSLTVTNGSSSSAVGHPPLASSVHFLTYRSAGKQRGKQRTIGEEYGTRKVFQPLQGFKALMLVRDGYRHAAENAATRDVSSPSLFLDTWAR